MRVSHCGKIAKSPSFQEGSQDPSRNEKDVQNARWEHLTTTHGDHTVTTAPFVFCSAKVGTQWLAPAKPSFCHGASSPVPPAHGNTHQHTCACVYVCPDNDSCACIPMWMGLQLVWYTETLTSIYVSTGLYTKLRVLVYLGTP